MINIGEINELRVVRKSDLGYMITDETDEILLHFREANKELQDNEMVNVFVYYDKKGRLAATTNTPYVTLTKPGFAPVVEINTEMGIFVSNNCGKDVIISKDYLPYDVKKWPNVGDQLLIELREKKNSFSAKILNKDQILDLKDKNTSKYAKGEMVEGNIVRLYETGYGIATKGFDFIFVHETQARGIYHLGQLVNVKILSVAPSDYTGTLNENKEVLVDNDVLVIINYLKNHGNRMPYTAKSSSEDIEHVFKLSRKAFKRALGALYKDHKVTIDEENTYLVIE